MPTGDDDHRAEVTDEYMRTMLTRSAPYSVVILERGPAYGSPGSDAIVWEHGRLDFELHAAGLLVGVPDPGTPGRGRPRLGARPPPWRRSGPCR